MSSAQTWRDFKDEDHARKYVETPRLVVVHRPILVHDRIDRGKKLAPCDCGCGSTRAYVVERLEHLVVLFDRISGTRKVRSRVTDKAEFDRLAATAQRVDMPIRCYRKQYRIIRDKKTKIIAVFGGNRAGKTQVAVEWLVDQWLLRGRRGAKFWWVSPSRQQTRIGVSKLVQGEVSDRTTPPVIHPALVVSYPKNELSGDQAIRLIDGSRIELRFASREGDHLKGHSAIAVVLDEGTSVAHEINWTILLNRTMDSGGQLLTCTTPVAGHWLEKIHRNARSYKDAALEDRPTGTVTEQITCFDNPWQDPDEIERIIEELGGKEDPRVKREVFGEWISNGTVLWRHYEPKRHNTEMAHREPELYGWHNLTPSLVPELWEGLSTARPEFVGGMDFNFDPMSMVVVRVLCKPKADRHDPNNWVLYVEDEILKFRCRSAHDFAEFLSKDAGVMNGRGLARNYFSGMHVVCDGTGFFKGQRGAPSNQRPDAIQLESHGFVMRPPEWKKGTPCNPPRRARIAFLNELFYRDRLIINASRCPKLIESLKTELDDGTGDTKKRSDTVADKISGITDALGYVAYALLYRANELEGAKAPEPMIPGLSPW